MEKKCNNMQKKVWSRGPGRTPGTKGPRSRGPGRTGPRDPESPGTLKLEKSRDNGKPSLN